MDMAYNWLWACFAKQVEMNGVGSICSWVRACVALSFGFLRAGVSSNICGVSWYQRNTSKHLDKNIILNQIWNFICNLYSLQLTYDHPTIH